MDETARLKSLQSLRILDSRGEERFDRITRMAQRVFGVDICLVSLVDADRQWFKSRQGIEATETRRDISFCGHAIIEDKLFIIGDASRDPRFADNPLVTGEPHIRFYAGCPIRGPHGYRIGTLCLIDRNPRGLSIDDQETLRDLAALVEDELAVASQVTQDELTGVANRRGLELVAGHLLSLCRRTGTDADLLFFDLDRFKSINDEQGHSAGDRALRAFADLLLKCFRAADVVARIGGDEFAVLMAGSGPEPDAALERLAAMCDGRPDGLVWSVGRVRFEPNRHDGPDAMLADADRLMYQQKRSKRSATLG